MFAHAFILSKIAAQIADANRRRDLKYEGSGISSTCARKYKPPRSPLFLWQQRSRYHATTAQLWLSLRYQNGPARLARFGGGIFWCGRMVRPHLQSSQIVTKAPPGRRAQFRRNLRQNPMAAVLPLHPVSAESRYLAVLEIAMESMR
jgi:hypothetical protein